MQITAKWDFHSLQQKIIKMQYSVNALTYGDTTVILSALHRARGEHAKLFPPPTL